MDGTRKNSPWPILMAVAAFVAACPGALMVGQIIGRVTVVTGSAREVSLAGHSKGDTEGRFLVLRVDEQPWVDEIFGDNSLDHPHDWRTGVTDPRLSDESSLQAAEDAWIASQFLLERGVDADWYQTVERVDPGSVADEAGIEVADRIIGLKPGIIFPEEGTTVRMGVIHGSEVRDLTLDVPAGEPGDGMNRLGLLIINHGIDSSDHVRPLIPVDETGPSSGLVHALALVDASSQGDLSGGRIVAATGTIYVDGWVGVIGGVQHKTRAAIRAHASVLFVPEANYDEALAAAGGRIEVVVAHRLVDVISWLCHNFNSNSSACNMVP